MSTDITFNDSLVLFALHREAQPFLREFRPQQKFPGAPCLARFCGPAWLSVLVMETGVGAGRMDSALGWALGKPVLENVPYRPKLVLSAGFSGALHERFQVGDVVLATEVVDEAGNRWPTTWPGELPAGEWRPPLHRGRVLCSNRLIGDPEEKRKRGQEHDALAVDMESAAVARLCSQKQVPFGCVRVISDRMETRLSPQLLSVLAGGRVSAMRLGSAVLRAPRMMGELWRLAKETRVAAAQLGLALAELLTLTLPA